ncbi:MAG: hypothetical protein K6F45_08745 [Saccharofermentans sp.]|nr:hypothetical protein [Saccharofermentans sp.]
MSILLISFIALIVDSIVLSYLYEKLAVIMVYTSRTKSKKDPLYKSFHQINKEVMLGCWGKKLWFGIKIIPLVAIWWFISALVIFSLKDFTAVPANPFLLWYYNNLFYGTGEMTLSWPF